MPEHSTVSEQGAVPGDKTGRNLPAGLKLRPVFQPIVSLDKYTIYGYEGLIRGSDSKGSLIGPYPLFERAAFEGYIPELDRKCRESLLEAFAGYSAPEKAARLFLNVHPAVIEDVDLPRELHEAVIDHKVRAEDIILEIDECRIKSTAALIRFTERCRNYGFKLALDDFGVFPCNPDRISSVRPDVLKIDISLVRELPENEHAALAVKTLIELAAGLGSTIIAEGVETELEAMHVYRAGCRYIQGFYFARPAELGNIPVASIGKKLRGLSNILRNIQAAPRSAVKKPVSSGSRFVML